MAYDEYGNWQDDPDPYQYADYTKPNPDGSTWSHTYDPATGQEGGHTTNSDGTPWAPTPTGHVSDGAYYGYPPSAAPTPPPTTPPGTTTPPPSTTAPPPSGGGGGGSYASPNFNWPTFTAPPLPTIAPLQAPPPFSFEPFSFESYRAPDPFTFDAFKAPTMADAQNEPGYQFGVDQGLGALKNALAARGTYRTGAAPKEFFTWANKAAEQNYGNVYNRATNTYGINRNNAFENFGANETARAQAYDRNRGNAYNNWQANETTAENAYKTNWGVTTDTYDKNTGTTLGLYDRNLAGKTAEFNPQQRQAELTFADLYNRWKAGLDSTTAIATAGAG